MTAASSVSESCFHAGIAPLAAPLSTVAICLPLSGIEHDGRPTSGLIGPAPMPLAWWQAVAIGVVDLLATCDQFSELPFLGRIVGQRRHGFFLPSTHAV